MGQLFDTIRSQRVKRTRLIQTEKLYSTRGELRYFI